MNSLVLRFCVLVLTVLISTVTCNAVYEQESVDNPIFVGQVDGEHLHQMFGNILKQLEAAANIQELRIRRHSNKKNALFGDRLCCDFPNMSSKRDVKSCHREFLTATNETKDATPEGHQNASKCFMECVARKKGWVGEDGHVAEAVVRESLLAGNLTEQWRKLQTDAADRCFAELKQLLTPNEANVNKSCKSGSQQLLYCIFEHTFLNCPKDSWHETEKCRAAVSLVSAMADRRNLDSPAPVAAPAEGPSPPAPTVAPNPTKTGEQPPQEAESEEDEADD